MIAVLPFALMGLLALVAPRFGTDSRPEFRSRPRRG